MSRNAMVVSVGTAALLVGILASHWLGSGALVIVLSILCAGLGSAGVRLVSRLERRQAYLEGALDALPMPVTITDLDMRWIFVNRTAEAQLPAHTLDRQTCVGKPCSNWQAEICGTEKCGVMSLRRGRPRNHYHQTYPDRPSTWMQVDTSYLMDAAGRQIGHVETVTDIGAQRQLQDSLTALGTTVEQTSASMLELTSSTRETSNSATEANQLIGRASVTVVQVSDAMNGLLTSMDEISRASEETSKIVKTIDEIAFQTNLLALNAAVEAARAGDAGRGFAVVAEEVRNLSQRAAEAARNTSDLIGDTVQKIRSGHGQVQRNHADFQGLTGVIEDAKGLLSRIETSAREQSAGIEQINLAVTSLDRLAKGGGAAPTPRSRR